MSVNEPTKKRRGVLYAKFANVDNVVHAKATDVTSDQQCRLWFGDCWKDKWLSGAISRIERVDGKRFFVVLFVCPDGNHEKRVWDLKCRPGPWVDPRPPPQIRLHGTGDPQLPSSPNLLLDETQPTDCSSSEDEGDGVSALGASPDDSVRIGLFPADAGDDDDGEDDYADAVPHAAAVPVVQTDSFSWFAETMGDEDVNGPVREIAWGFRDTGGSWMEDGDDTAGKRPLLEYFMATMPPAALKRIIRLMNEKLNKAGLEELDVGELIKFFGVLLLITRFEFGDRASLWSTKMDNPYIPAVCLGETTGMRRNQFDSIWRYLTFSECPDEQPEWVTSSAAHRWMHVDDFVTDFNCHRRANFRPSEIICIDESMCRWYGIGGDWINDGLPQYITMERKVCMDV